MVKLEPAMYACLTYDDKGKMITALSNRQCLMLNMAAVLEAQNKVPTKLAQRLKHSWRKAFIRLLLLYGIQTCNMRHSTIHQIQQVTSSMLRTCSTLSVGTSMFQQKHTTIQAVYSACLQTLGQCCLSLHALTLAHMLR